MAEARANVEEDEAVEIVLQEGSDVEEDVLEEIEGEVGDLEYFGAENVPFPLADDEVHASDEEESEVLQVVRPPESGSAARSEIGSAAASTSTAEPRAGPSREATRSRSATPSMPADVADPVSDDSEDEEYMYDWVRNLHHYPVNAPFDSSEAGLRLNMPDDAQPVDFYKVFITRDIIKLMKVETNRYASSAIQEKEASGRELSSRSMYRKWDRVSEEDITRFLAILIHMGVVHKPHLTDYWSRDPAIASSFAPSIMPRERFRAILAFFHLNDNTQMAPRGGPNFDPLHKLRPLVDHLRSTFKEAYMPMQNVCIDEALCPWRGRVPFRVYMKDKPTKWGMKLYELCDSSIGYVWDFEVMCRKPNVSNTPFDVCHRLMQPLLNKGHVLYVDNYYCNPALAFSMTAQDTGVVGTVRANRVGLPRDFMAQPMQRGDMDYRRQNQVLLLRWKDKRDVSLLTSKHLPVMREAVSRTERKQKPTAVIDYTHNMAGVDRSDQMVAYMPLHRKTVKWWKKLAFHLLTLVMVQAHCLYNVHRRSLRRRPISLKKFVLAVCNSLAQQPVPAAQPQIASSSTSASGFLNRLTHRHFLEPIPSPPGKSRVQKGCVVCYAKLAKTGVSLRERRSKRKVTTFQCAECQKPVCVHPCFKVLHTQEHYDK